MFDGPVLDAIKAVATKNRVQWQKLAAVVEVESNGVAAGAAPGGSSTGTPGSSGGLPGLDTPGDGPE